MVHSLVARSTGGGEPAAESNPEDGMQGGSAGFGGFGGGGLKGGLDAAGGWYDSGVASPNGSGTPLACELAKEGDLAKLREVLRQVCLYA
eukprot:SAG31_NODE_3469_length_4238_cov_2.647741_2_plen_90_part_00